jgi:glucose/mannose-6-phosphate isomerase
VTLPGGFPPRAALGYSFTALYLALAKFGFTNEPVASLHQLSEFLKGRIQQLHPEIDFDNNEAKKLAAKIHGRIPVIYGAAGAMAVAALRWKGQFCENAENLAFAGETPEFNHNEVVGWGLPEGSTVKLIVVILQSPADHERISKRFEIVRSLADKKGIPVKTVMATGDNPLQHLFSLVQYGDWVSFYLAILNGVDPTPVAAIDYFKGKLDDADK